MRGFRADIRVRPTIDQCNHIHAGGAQRGGQPTAAPDMDMGAVAMASGWSATRDVTTHAEFTDALAWAKETQGPLLVRVYIDTEQLPTDFFLEDPVVLASDFRRWLETSAGS